MKTTKIVLPSVLIFLGIVYYFSFDYIYTTAKNNIINQHVENAKIEANIISNMLAEKLASGYSKEQVKEEFQKSIENMPIDNSFVCMFDSTGREICHPNRQKIGSILDDNNSTIQSISNVDIEQNFKKSIQQNKSTGGLRKLRTYTEIVYLAPVKNTGWVVASHSNIIKFQKTFSAFKEKLFFIFILVWLSSSLLIFFFLQYINSNNLKKIDALNSNTVARYFKELKIIKENLSSSNKNNSVKIKRLLAYKGAKLKPVNIEDIAYIYTQDKITYIVDYDNNSTTINNSLDELFKLLDNSLFYRATRQIIISAKSIDKIEKYGNTQLKVHTNPISPVSIIISKAKITDFKQWAGKN